MANSWLTIQEGAPRLKQALRWQLAKDLGLSPDEVPQEKLVNWLTEWLERHTQEWAGIMYRVDVPEHLARSGGSFQELALRILEREAQKVLFRAQYSGKA